MVLIPYKWPHFNYSAFYPSGIWVLSNKWILEIMPFKIFLSQEKQIIFS